MSTPSDNDIRRLRERLAKRREELRWLVHDALIESKREDFLELAGTVHDAGEESVADLLEGLNQSLLNREVAELADVEATLERIRKGSYGACVDCGEPIGRERLEANPAAECCIACQARRESEGRSGRDFTPSL